MSNTHDIGALEIRIPFDVGLSQAEVERYVRLFALEFGCDSALVLNYSSDGVVGPGCNIQWPLVRFNGRMSALVAVRERFDIHEGV